MGWFIIGLILGGLGLWGANWARAKNIHIDLYASIFLALGVLVLALGVMDFRTSLLATEPDMTVGVLWVYGIPGLVLVLIAVGLIWWQNRQSTAASTENQA